MENIYGAFEKCLDREREAYKLDLGIVSHCGASFIANYHSFGGILSNRRTSANVAVQGASAFQPTSEIEPASPSSSTDSFSTFQGLPSPISVDREDSQTLSQNTPVVKNVELCKGNIRSAKIKRKMLREDPVQSFLIQSIREKGNVENKLMIATKCFAEVLLVH